MVIKSLKPTNPLHFPPQEKMSLWCLFFYFAYLQCMNHHPCVVSQLKANTRGVMYPHTVFYLRFLNTIDYFVLDIVFIWMHHFTRKKTSAICTQDLILQESSNKKSLLNFYQQVCWTALLESMGQTTYHYRPICTQIFYSVWDARAIKVSVFVEGTDQILIKIFLVHHQSYRFM